MLRFSERNPHRNVILSWSLLWLSSIFGLAPSFHILFMHFSSLLCPSFLLSSYIRCFLTLISFSFFYPYFLHLSFITVPFSFIPFYPNFYLSSPLYLISFLFIYSLFSGSRYTTVCVLHLSYGPDHEGLMLRIPASTRYSSLVQMVSTVSEKFTTQLRPYPHSCFVICACKSSHLALNHSSFKINFISLFPYISFWIYCIIAYSNLVSRRLPNKN
jgi:hypothetical protein